MPDPAYEWDERKRAGNLQKHEIDFMDALEVFERPHILIRSDRDGEERWGALGLLGERTIVVFFTPRGRTRRLISARSARRDEKDQYHARFVIGAAARPDRSGDPGSGDG